MMSHIAVDVRVSTRKRDTRSQEPDLQRWLEAFANGGEVRWYRDHATGKTMDRPGWKQLEAKLDAGGVSQIVVWRLDRLGRTASGLAALFDRLVAKRIGLVTFLPLFLPHCQLRDRRDHRQSAARLGLRARRSRAAVVIRQNWTGIGLRTESKFGFSVFS